MKAVGMCPGCKKKVYEFCDACIESGTLVHKCKTEKDFKVFEKVKWNILDDIPQSEDRSVLP